MLLLPDLNFILYGVTHVLSIQDPYTLDGELVTRICTEFSLRGDSDKIQISNGSETIEVDYDVFINEINRCIYHFLSDHPAMIVGEDNPRYQWRVSTSYSAGDYINDLIHHCELMDRDRNYISECRTRLLNQGRIYRERESLYTYVYDPWDVTSSTLSNSSVTTVTSQCIENSPLIYNGSLHLADDIEWDTVTLHSRNSNTGKYIHSYNYKPEYIKHYMKDEDHSTLLLGAEIEVAGNKNDMNKEEVVKKCIQIMNQSDSDKEDLIYSTSDSTVQIELDTMPCSLAFHKQMNYKEMFKYLDECGYKGHDCESAGLHIHANRSYLGNSELKQQLVISKILYILEKFNDEICVIARRNNYSKFVGKDEVSKSLDVLYNKYKNTGKKVALNLQHKDTIEFRCFRSTLKYETFILTLEFVKDIIDYAKSINIEDIEMIQWEDLMDIFSDDLKEYYNNRLKKAEKKKETETIITLGTATVTTLDSRTGIISNDYW